MLDQFIERIPRTQKKIIDISVFYGIFQTFMKSLSLTKCLINLILEMLVLI